MDRKSTAVFGCAFSGGPEGYFAVREYAHSLRLPSELADLREREIRGDLCDCWQMKIRKR
ncbi:MAG: hypothetical protein IJC29_04720 [Clostridia bacterium]|nr:hypothetical protein [Clostridia bacterium]